MRKQTWVIFVCLLSAIDVTISDDGSPVSNQRQNLKLFVFGDSYADTGNWPKSYGGSWQEPYGISFPGRPSGRFSDGRVLTDYIAAILGTKSPITYRGWKSGEKKSTKYGMNFAYGGTGVFNTLVSQPNMSTQVDFFQELVRQNQSLRNSSSIAIISLAGNDYATFFSSKRNLQDLPELTKSIINQLVSDVKRIQELGVGKIGITSLEPLGCLPPFTASLSYQNCSNSENSVAEFHNQVLVESLRKLNNESDDKSRFVIIDLYKAFSFALNLQPNLSTAGNPNTESLLKPCCRGITEGYSCGDVEKGTKILKYSVCDNPSDSFFWDTIHPSQQGWFAVSSYLRSSLLRLL